MDFFSYLNFVIIIGCGGGGLSLSLVGGALILFKEILSYSPLPYSKFSECFISEIDVGSGETLPRLWNLQAACLVTTREIQRLARGQCISKVRVGRYCDAVVLLER